MNHITSPDEPFLSASDLAQATNTHAQGRWHISARKLPISRAAAIDEMTEQIGIPIPEMIFGDNRVALRHAPSGWTISFDARDALDKVDKTGQGRLQVAYASDWARSREMSAVEGIRDVRPYDWSYSTAYKGTEVPGRQLDGPAAPQAPEPPRAPGPPSSAGGTSINGTTSDSTDSVDSTRAESASSSSSIRRLVPTSTPTLPLELLRRRDPILFHDDVILYESELDDNGISVLRVKIRVMPQRLLLLSRFYMRLDNVVVRVRDTRVYVDFATDEVLREYTAREDSFENVRRNLTLSRGLPPDSVMVAMRDANQVADLLPVVDHTMESVDLGR